MQRGAEFMQTFRVAQLEHFAQFRKIERVDHVRTSIDGSWNTITREPTTGDAIE
jgi:hypothetical protein